MLLGRPAVAALILCCRATTGHCAGRQVCWLPSEQARSRSKGCATSAACLQPSSFPYLGSTQALAPLELASASAGLPGLPLSTRHAPKATSGIHGVKILLVQRIRRKASGAVGASVLTLQREVESTRGGGGGRGGWKRRRACAWMCYKTFDRLPAKRMHVKGKKELCNELYKRG